jgi:DNA ligase 1
MLTPLLAEPYTAGRVDPTGWWMSEKLDGLRAIWDPNLRVLKSRKNHVFPAPAWFLEKLPDVPLDGELWLGRGMLERTSSIVRSSQDKGWKELKFCLIDIPDRDAGPFEVRQEALRKLVRAGMDPWVVLIPQMCCASAEMLQLALDLTCQQGGEGLMIRQPGSPYVHARSTTLLKVKKWIDAEAVVESYHPGKNGNTGFMGALYCRTPEGMIIKVGTGFTHLDRKNPPPIGCTITYHYTHKTKTGKPRTPGFMRIREEL